MTDRAPIGSKFIAIASADRRDVSARSSGGARPPCVSLPVDAAHLALETQERQLLEYDVSRQGGALDDRVHIRTVGAESVENDALPFRKPRLLASRGAVGPRGD